MKQIHMNMKCYGWILGVVCLLPPLCMAQTARLIYSLSNKETAQSQLAHPSKPYNVVTASIPEKLMKLRAYTKTEIFSVSIADIKRSLVFSDEGPYFEIIPGSFPGSMVVAGGKAYVKERARLWWRLRDNIRRNRPSQLHRQLWSSLDHQQQTVLHCQLR